MAVRLGGDEFVLVLPDLDLAAARSFAERVRLAVLAHDWATIAPGLKVTVSIGVACGPAAHWRAAMDAADNALYTAKNEGKNVVATNLDVEPLAAVEGP